MKGLIIAVLSGLGYAFSVAVAAHGFRPKRHSQLFMLAIPLWVLGYMTIYYSTPADFYFLPIRWQCASPRLDMIYGLIVFVLNCQNFVDSFFAVCGGFSTSLLSAIYQTKPGQLKTDQLIALYKTPSGADRIYEWRVPHLLKRGYLRYNLVTGKYFLNRTGRLIAGGTCLLKNLMNLGEGG